MKKIIVQRDVTAVLEEYYYINGDLTEDVLDDIINDNINSFSSEILCDTIDLSGPYIVMDENYNTITVKL